MQGVDHWIFVSEEGLVEFCSLGALIDGQKEVDSSGVFCKTIHTKEELNAILESLSST